MLYVSFIYLSEVKTTFTRDDLIALQELSVQRNKEHGITGYLSYLGDKFVQYIEGPPHEVTQLMANIRADDRHRVIAESSEARLVLRRFPQWFMRRLDDEDLRKLKHDQILADILANEQNEEPGRREAALWLMVERVVALERLEREAT